MRLYISGPMTGLPFNNRAAFQHAREHLRSRGHFVVCPDELDLTVNDQSSEVSRVLYRAFLTRDVAMLLTCDLDGIVMLDRWERSRGARLELLAALLAGLRIYSLNLYELRPGVLPIGDLLQPALAVAQPLPGGVA